MTTTVGQAMAQQDGGPAALVKRHEEKFSAVLPSHIQPGTFVGLAVGALHRNADLMKAASTNPGSFLNALLDAARLGHEPGTEAYYLVPFGNEVVGIEGYRGEIERIYRAGAVASVKAEVVYTGDTFEYSPSDDRPRHVIDWDQEDRGQRRLVYAYAIMKDGSTSKVVVLNRKQIQAHMKESRGSEKPSSPWQKWTDAMWLKTSIHQLEKWVPSSAEYRREQLRAAVEADNLRRVDAPTMSRPDRWVDADTGEIHEAEVVPEEQTPTEQPASA